MMKIDLFGSRYTLIPLMRNMEKFEYVINKAFLGSALASQYAGTQKVDSKLLNKKLAQYDKLEVLNDRLKLFRRFSSHSHSNIIIIDFLYEGFKITNSDHGRLTLTPSNLKYDKDIKNNKILNYDSRINIINGNFNLFLNDLKEYDVVILNRLRLPKFHNDTQGKLVLKESIQNINLMNAIIESFEDLLMEKLKDIIIIPLYDNHNTEGYWFSPGYLNHFNYHMETQKILMKYVKES